MSHLIPFQVTIWAGNIACKEECSFIGKWDLKSLTTISGVSGPENPSNDNVPRHVKFSFPNTVRCRIIWITLALQNMGSSSVNLPRECNLLSLDDSMELPLARRSLSDSTGSIDPRIHAKGIIVYGAHLPEELMSNSLKGSESMNMNSWSEMSPKVGRFRVRLANYGNLGQSFDDICHLYKTKLFYYHSCDCRFQLKQRG